VNPDGDDAPWDPDHRAAKFAELAAQADDVGTRRGLEFLPWSNIKNLHEGLRLVDAAGHVAAGLIIDVWHIERAHTQRRRSARHRDAVRGHRPSTEVLR
jgi:sugar phosphate isomerase/epimerase